MLFYLVNLFYKGNKIIHFLEKFAIFFSAVLLAAGGLFLFGFFLFSFFGKNDSSKDDLPLDMNL